MVNRNLHLHFRDMLPKTATNLLNGTSWEGMRHNMTLTAELFRILGLFNKSGIEVIPFKGPTLAVAAYGDLSLRMFADLDILVSEQDLDAAVDTLV
ncbi:MAG TPA: nucleotidyltransferase family protein, partial [Bryobacteraceae bacterium]